MMNAVTSVQKSVSDIAHYLLTLSQSGSNKEITHLKLQKLCYFAQAWSLALKEKPLFKEDLEAWTHGPVVPSLYQEYKNYGFSTIPKKSNFDNHSFNNDEKEILDLVWRLYGELDGKTLEYLTHEEEPWIKARRGCTSGEASNSKISQKEMKEYYKKTYLVVE